MGDAAAAAQLEGPECPEELEYLVPIAHELLGRSGVGLDGPAALSYEALWCYCDLTGVEVGPLEIAALLTLDAVLRNPQVELGEEDEEEEGQKEAPEPPKWRDRPPGVEPQFVRRETS